MGEDQGLSSRLLGYNGTEIYIDEDAPVEVGGPGQNNNVKPTSAPQVSGRAQFQYHRFMSGKAFNESSDLSKGQREYNRKQRETLGVYKDVDTAVHGGEVDASSQEEPHEGLAINLSNITNVVLLIIKIYASLKSGSLAIVASTLESLLDLLAGAILLFTRWSMKRENVYKYPIGKLRVQPVGIVVFAVIMATLGMQVMITAVEQLLEGDSSHKMISEERIWLIVVMGVAIISKFALYVYCRSFKSRIVHAYSLDHNFDMVTNVVGLAAALLADRYYWWIDPVGAMILAIYTIFEWSKTVLETAASLIGKAAPLEFIQKVTYITINHHNDIKRIDTVRAYTFGSLYFVEVDIELPGEMLLRDAHDIGENLQNKLEALPEVERAYVHLDFESTHKPEHGGRSKIISAK